MFVLAMVLATFEADARTVTRKVVDEEGNVYEGELRDGVRSGIGRLEWIDGRVYEGDFHDGKIHGNGRMSTPDGEVYEGTFDNEVRHGYGKLVFQNGDIYEGSFIQGKISGEGTLQETATGVSYRGLFRNGKRHGEGSLQIDGGQAYRGWFRDDLKEGFGELHQTDGNLYRGYFCNDVRHGDGVLEDQDSLYFQTWDNGALVSNQPIKIVENCRLEIEGEMWMFRGNRCIDGLAHGRGKAVNSDGSAYISHGVFVLGVRTSGTIVPLTNRSSSRSDD